MVIWMVLVAVIWQPRIGVYVLLGLAALFESLSQDPLMTPGHYLHYGLQHTLGLRGVVVSPLEMLLIATLLVWLIQGAVRGNLEYRGGRFGWPVLLFSLMLAVGVVWGRARGGDLHIGLFELRPLLYIVVTYVLAANLVRTRRQVQTLLTVGMLSMMLFTIECAYRRIFLIDTGQLSTISEMWYAHDGVVFIAGLAPLIVAQQAFGAPRWQRILGLFVLPLAVYAMMATERRAGQISLMVALLASFIVLLFVHRKAFCFIALPVLIAGAIYLPLFWNAGGVLGQPARAVRSITDPDPRDASSNFARDMEKINIRATIRAFPILGVGFGQPFLQVAALPDISFFPLWNYEPHHSLFWIWFKTGGIGFILFLILVGGAMIAAARAAKLLRCPELRVFAVFALGGIASALVFCYVDLGLASGRVTVFMGTLIGTISVLEQIQDT
jgi:hypothetical protein